MDNAKKFDEEFNALLVDTFHSILQTELLMIKEIADSSLSMREIHLIEIVGKSKSGITISKIAHAFSITLASVTALVNNLVSKGYLEKNQNETDKRSIRVFLTKKGKIIDTAHFKFHKKMVEEISSHLSEFEKQILFTGVSNLNNFFKSRMKKGQN